MWINKYIAHTGHTSRRNADKLVEEGRVTVNGDVATKTLQVYENDIVKVDGKYIAPPKRHRIYIAVNKPIGVVNTPEPDVRNNIAGFVGHEERLFPIGSMDQESQGLVFMTNDGDIVKYFTDAKYQVEKEYYVRVDKKISFEFIQAMLEGIQMDGELVKPVRIKRISPKAFRVTFIHEKRRMLRRICAQFGMRIFKLERVRIMHIHVRDIPLGDWRYLSKTEVKRMFKSINYHPAQKWAKPGEVADFEDDDEEDDYED